MTLVQTMRPAKPNVPGLDQFAAWSTDHLLAEQAAGKPKDPLYHYTDEAGLRGILSNAELWCFAHTHQTDPKEFRFSLSVAKRVINQLAAQFDLEGKRAGADFCRCLGDLIANNDLAGPFEFYLFSLSRHRDHESQWRHYARGGSGFAIGLSSALFQPHQQVNADANRNVLMSPVTYGPEATSVRHRIPIERAASIVQDNILAIRNKLPASVYLHEFATEVLASHLIWNCVTAKETIFADEKEVRGVIVNERVKFDRLRCLHNERPYVKTPLALKVPHNVTEILVGPNAPLESEEWVRSFLRDAGYSCAIPVRRSIAEPS